MFTVDWGRLEQNLQQEKARNTKSDLARFNLLALLLKANFSLLFSAE